MSGLDRFIRGTAKEAAGRLRARAPQGPAARSARRVAPAVQPESDPLRETARDILRDDSGRPILDPVTGQPILAGEGAQPSSPEFAEENFVLDDDGNAVPLEKPDPRLAVLEAIGLAMRGLQQGPGGPVVRNNALADLIAERQALRSQEIAALPPRQNVVASDSKGLSPSSEIPEKPASTVDFETGRQGAPLGGETLSEDPFEQIVPVAVDGPLERQYVPALDEFGNPKQAYVIGEDGDPVPAGETIPAATVDRWDPQIGAYVTTGPGPLRPVSNAPVFEQTLSGETHQRIDPTTGRGLTEPVYENVQGQVVRRGPPTYHVGRRTQGPDGKVRIEVDTSRPVVVLERSRAGSDGNRSAESRVFLTPRKDGTYQVMTMGADGSPSYLRATDSDVQRLLAQGYSPVHGSLDVQRPAMPESPEALARAIVETRAGTVSDGATYRVGVDSAEAKADIIAQVDQLRKFGSVEDLRRFFEELGSARVALDDVGEGADNAIARGQMAYKAFVDSAPTRPPVPQARPEFTPNAVREDLIRRLVSTGEQVVSPQSSATDIPVANPSAAGAEITTAAAGPDFVVSPDGSIRRNRPSAEVASVPGATDATMSAFTPVPDSFDLPTVAPAASSLDLLSGLRRFNPDVLDSRLSPATTGAGMMDFTITPSGQATLASSALDDLLAGLRRAAPASADVAAGSARSAETLYPRLPDTFFNQYATSSVDVSGPGVMPAPAGKRPWTRSRGILQQPLADRVRAARERRATGLSMPTQSSFDDMLSDLQGDFSSTPAPEENVREAVEAIMAGNARKRVSEQGRVLESAPTTIIGPEVAVRSSASARADTAAAASEAEDTAKLLRGAESVMPQSAGLTRDQLRKLAVEGLGRDVRAPLAFKTVEMRSSQARPGAATLDKMAESDARIEALRDSLEADYPDPDAIRSRLNEISKALKSGDAARSPDEYKLQDGDVVRVNTADDRAALRAERARLREKLADSEIPGYMEARNSALEEIANAEAAAREAQDGFAATSMGSGAVADAQQSILSKLMSSSGTFNEQEFFKAAEDLFGSTSKGGAVDAPRVFNAIRKAARAAGMPEPSDSDIIFAALNDLQDPTRHAMGERGLRAAADYIARGLNARTSSTPLGPDAPVLAIGPHDRPKSTWELIDEQFGRVAGPMLDTPSPAPPLEAVYDKFIPPFLRLPSTRDNVDLAFQGMSIPEAQQALEQLDAAEAAARSVTLPPTQDPAVLANIIAEARAAGRRRLGNVPPASRQPLTLTEADSQAADISSLERDAEEWRRSVEYLESDTSAYPPKLDSNGRRLADHPEVAAAKSELKDAEQRLEAARAEAPASDQSMDPRSAGGASSEQRSRLFTLAAKRASLQRTAIAAEASSQADVVDRVRQEIAAVDAEIDALYSGQSSAAIEQPRVERPQTPQPQLRASLYSTPSPVQLRSADDLRDAVRLAPDRIGYAFVIPKETAQTLRSRVNPELARMRITRETGPDEVALSGLIGGGEISGGIRFANPSDLSRIPTDGSVEVLHLDKDGRPTFYDPSGMDLRNPTPSELKEMRRDAARASRMSAAAEDEAMAVSSRPPVSGDLTARGGAANGAAEAEAAASAAARVDVEPDPPAALPESERPVFDQNDVGDSGMDRTGESPRAARLARNTQSARARADAAEAQARAEKAQSEAREAKARAEKAEAEARARAEEEGKEPKGRESVVSAKNARRLGTLGALAAAGYYFREPLGELVGGDTAEAALVGDPVFGDGYSDGEDTNSSAERALSRVRRARTYGYHTSQNPLPR